MKKEDKKELLDAIKSAREDAREDQKDLLSAIKGNSELIQENAVAIDVLARNLNKLDEKMDKGFKEVKKEIRSITTRVNILETKV